MEFNMTNAYSFHGLSLLTIMHDKVTIVKEFKMHDFAQCVR